MITKDQATKELLDWHFQTAPEIVKVYRFFSDNEDATDEPIKLLEVSEATLATGSVTPFGFARTEELPYPTVIAMVTPEEIEKIEHKSMALPKGWRLEHMRLYSRSQTEAEATSGRR